MKVTRIYTGTDGESHFEDVKILLNGRATYDFQQSKLMKATGVGFIERDGIFNMDWHSAPQRQYIIVIEGELVMETIDGTKRQFGPGTILLAEDTTGRGHLTRGMNTKAVFITLD